VRLAVENPADAGEFRVFNQFTEVFSVQELADLVAESAGHIGLVARVEHIENPRVESEDHWYNPRNDALLSLGLKPRLLSEELVEDMLARIAEHRDAIDNATLLPSVRWREDTSTPAR
jgi:UDP-sulfoquinovose synthase